MTVVVNGSQVELTDTATVADAIAATGAPSKRGVAVALNGEVVPRSTWADTTLNPGDKVEVLTAVAGG